MSWKEFLNQIVAKLTEYLKKDIQYSSMTERTVRQIAWREIELFVENFKQWPPEKLILKENTKISGKDRTELKKFLNKRKKGIPLAYIIGKQSFCGLDFKVNKNVLIPRPETEELVDYVLQYISSHITRYLPTSNVLIDIGTGSGCILTAILKYLPKNTKLSEIYAVDRSKKALGAAKQNITKHLGGKFEINFINKSLLPDKLPRSRKYIIVANLPYLSKKEYQNLSPEVKKYEPKGALVGGVGGHELICKLIDRVVALKIDFDLFLEISPTIYLKIKKHCAKQNIKLKKLNDITGKIRILRLTYEL